MTAPTDDKERLFHPHLRGGKPGDKHSRKVVSTPLAGFKLPALAVADETGDCVPPIPYGFRSFDRQWIIPDPRLINQANPKLWELNSGRQVFLTVPEDRVPTGGPAITVSAIVPDLHHYNGRGGRVFPLWADGAASMSNVRPALLAQLHLAYGRPVPPEDLFVYIAAVAAHPAYIERFRADLAQPGLRIPLTADAATFVAAAAVGRRIVWLHTFGERMVDPAAGRPAGAPRLPAGRRPQVPVGGAIPTDAAGFPDSMSYDATRQRLLVGTAFIEPVPPAVWRYEVSGKQVLTQWFSYRRRTRERPIIGDRRPPSPLGEIQPDTWPADYTTELLNVLNVLGLLVDLEPELATMLERICTGPLLDTELLRERGAFGDDPLAGLRETDAPDQADLFKDGL